MPFGGTRLFLLLLAIFLFNAKGSYLPFASAF
jgi:hypothetical protein